MLNEMILNRIYEITSEEKSFLLDGPFDTSIFSDEYPDMVDYHKLMPAGTQICARMHSRFGAYPNHNHNFIELVYMCKGKTVHIINGKSRIKLCEGDLLFISQHAYHSIERADFNDIALNLFILPQLLDHALNVIKTDNPMYSFLFSCLSNTMNTYPVLIFNTHDVLHVQNLMENILWYLTSVPNSNLQMVEQTLTLLIVELQNHVESLVQLMPDDYDGALVLLTIRYIEKNYATATLNEIASQLNQPIYRLSRLIHAGTGNTFSTLLLNTRMRKAAAMLTETNMSIQSVISAVGYSNASFFYECFKKKTGMTPAEYRKAKGGNR